MCADFGGKVSGTPTYTSGTILDLSYNYVDASGHNNGNVASIAINQGSGRSQSFTYDSLNRIKTAQTVATHATGPTDCWAETYGYDPWGNLTFLGADTTKQSAYIGCSQESGFSITATLKNQLNGYCYDAAGNLVLNTNCPTPPFTPTYSYNAENQLISAGGVNYTYDGDGKRVMKSSGTIYWYGTGSNPLSETDLAGTFKYRHYYFNGMRVARRETNNWLDQYGLDALGNARYVYGNAGNADVADFYPFGGARSLQSAAGNKYKFTGKERDSESGLDNFGARYDSSNLGRFMSPDPVTATPLHIINPQRWNMYAYGMNNPLFYVDPDGRDAIAVNFTKEVPIGGHEGIISVHPDGSATYARFGPQTSSRPFDKGKVDSSGLSTKIQFDKNGLPTTDSYQAVAKEVAGKEGQDPNTVRMNYFKTSDADTAALDAWIQRIQQASDQGKAPDYDVTRQNCAAFCIAGLIQSHAIQNNNISLIPNRLFDLLSRRARENYPLREKVTSKICSGEGDNRKCR